MRVDRKFSFYGRLVALVAPTTLGESSNERVWIACGKMWYIRPNGSQVRIEDEDQAAEPAAPTYLPLELGDEVESRGELVASAASEAGASDERAPGSCAIVVRDFGGKIPLAHAGQYIALVLVRRGIFRATDDSQQPIAFVTGIENAVLVAADYRSHVYDVERCKNTRIDNELSLKSIIDALTRPRPLDLIAELRETHARRDDTGLAVRGRPPGSIGLAASGDLATEQICAMYARERSKLTTLAGLLAVLPAMASRARALLSFTGFYQAHAIGAYVLRSADVTAQLATVHPEARELQRCSAHELELLAELDQPIDNEQLTIAERLFFGALLDRLPLSEYEQALGRWGGVYFSGRRVASADATRAFAIWSKQAADIVSATGDARRHVGYVAWALYDAAYGLMRQTPGATVFTHDAAARRCAERHPGDQRLAIGGMLQRAALELLLQIDVWRPAPRDTALRVGARLAATEPETVFVMARAHDVSMRLAAAVFGLRALFVDQVVWRAELVARTTPGTLVLYAGSRPRTPDAVVARSLHALFERDRLDQGTTAATEVRVARECSHTVMLLDAHLLSEVQLLRALIMLGAESGRVGEPKPLTLIGDVRQASAFASMSRIARRVRPIGATAPRFYTANAPAKKHQADVLRLALYQALAPDAAPVHATDVAQCLARTVAPLPSGLDVGQRWILVASTYEAAAAALSHLAHQMAPPLPPVTDDEPERELTDEDRARRALGNALWRLADEPRRLVSTLLLTQPWLGYRGECVRVRRALLCTTPSAQLDAPIAESACTDVGFDQHAVSLDAESLLLDVEQDGNEDHRRCCNTWHPDVMRAAVHRASLSAQSLVMARDSVPLARTHSATLLLCDHYGADALYAAAVHASHAARRFVAHLTPHALGPVDALGKRMPAPQTCVADIYAGLMQTLPV